MPIELAWTTSAAPWVHVVPQTAAADALAVPADSGRVVHVQGEKCRTLDRLFESLAAAFRLPGYFGRNWPALHECLLDETALVPSRSYRLVITQADALLTHEATEWPTFLRTTRTVGESRGRTFALDDAWGGGDVPFNTVLIGAPASRLAAGSRDEPIALPHQ